MSGWRISVPQATWMKSKNNWLKLFVLVAGIFLINVSILLNIRLTLIWVLVFLLLIQVVRPIFALILMIPVYFRGFGLFPRQFLGQFLGVIEPRDIAFIFLMGLTFVVCVTSPRVFTRVRRSVLFFPILFLTSFVLLRILLTGLEVGNPILALRTGRSYFSYLLYFAVIAFVSNRQKGRWFLNGLIIMGIILALITFLAQVAPGWFVRYFSTIVATLPAYQSLGVKAQTPGIFLMFLVFIWCFFRWLQFRRGRDLVLLFILGGGFLLQKYRTFYLLLPLSIFLVWLLARKPHTIARRQLQMMISVTMLGVVSSVLILWANPTLRADIARFVWEAQVSATGQVKAGTTYERIQEASWRLELWIQRPILGVGFIHNELAQKLFKQPAIRTDHISYADILVTGGVVLMLAVSLVILTSWWFLFKGLRRHGLGPDSSWVVAGAMAFSLMSTFGVTWSLLSLDTGIVPLILALGLAERYLTFDAGSKSAKPLEVYPVVNTRSKPA